MKGQVFLFIILFFAIQNIILAKENEAAVLSLIEKQGLHLDKRWLNLGHYREAFGTDRFISESKPGEFFFSDTGNTSPKNELRATILAFLDRKQKSYCDFPARFLYLKNVSPELFKDFELNECKDFQIFRNKLAANSLALVFSSYHLNSPASTFGHTLLRFMKKEGQVNKDFELLDYATNYAANVTTNNPFLYGLFGMTGFFRGEFTSLPYFYKVREYNDYESRDLWSYELNLSDEELEKIIAHLWELRRAYFPYYYFTKNCSYYMLTLLDVANPNWKFAQRMGKFSIPVETIKLIDQTPGLLKRTSFRPSKQRLLDERLKALDSTEQRLILKTLEDDQISRLLSKDQNKSAELLDVAIDGLDYLYAKEFVNEKPEVMKKKRKYLVARSHIKSDVKTPKISAPKDQDPKLSHGSTRLSFHYGESDVLGRFSSLELRLSLHDLLDPIAGHQKGSRMEMGRFRIKHFEKSDQNSSFFLDEFTFVHVEMLTPMRTFFKKYSWNFYLGARRLKDNVGYNKLAPQIKGSFGKSLALSPFTLSGLIHLGIEQNSKLSSSSFRGSVGPKLQLLGHLPYGINALAFAKVDYFAFTKKNESHTFWGLELRKGLLKDLTFSFSTKYFETGTESLLGFNYYY